MPNFTDQTYYGCKMSDDSVYYPVTFQSTPIVATNVYSLSATTRWAMLSSNAHSVCESDFRAWISVHENVASPSGFFNAVLCWVAAGK